MTKTFLTALVALCAATAAQAARVDFQITGTVLSSTEGDAVGSAVTGRLSYDSDASGMMVFDPSVMLYTFPSSTTLEVRIGGKHITSDYMGASIIKGSTEETLQFVGSGIRVNGEAVEGATLVLGLANFDTATPSFGDGFPAAFNLADLETHAGLLMLPMAAQPSLAFDITSISAVPEPSTAMCVLAGLAVAGAALRQRQSVSRRA